MNDIFTLAHTRVNELNAKWWIKSCDKSDNFADECVQSDNIQLEEEDNNNSEENDDVNES